MHMEVEFLEGGVGHLGLALGVVQAQRSDVLREVANTRLVPCHWEGMSEVSMSPQWIRESCTRSSHLRRDRT